MLEQILDYIHNYFVKGVYCGLYRISGGTLTMDVLQEGQYYRIVGSIFNDGVHRYSSEETSLMDEEFMGEIWAMAVPPAVIALSDEISAWIEKYGDAMNSPYQSESFGGYSYNKGSGGSGGSAIGSADWRSVFGSRLNRWRKINDEFIVPRKQDVGHGQVSAYTTRTEVNDMIQDATHNVLRAEDD